MKKIILLFTTVFLLYMSSTALEPVRIGLNYPTGASFVVELKDYTDPNNPVKKYPLAGKPDFVKTLSPNTSGVVSFVVGEGDPDWGGIAPNQINPNVIVDVKVSGNLVAQFNLLDIITNQASTGNGNILNDGFSSSEGVTFPDATNLTNDFVFGSVKLDRLSYVEETKFFFDHSKAAFRTGRINNSNWNESNLGEFTFAAGKDNKASGNGAVAFGEGTSALSYGEVAIGSYNTAYTPNSTTAYDANDRAFVIGNGTAGTPSDAFIIQKNGNMTVGGSLTVLGATVTNSNLTVGGTTIDPNTGNLIVAGTTTMNGNASVTGANTFSVGTGATTLGGTLDVTGLLSADGGIDVDGAFTVADATGNISTTGTLGAGNSTINGTLDVTSLLSADGGIDVDGAFTVADATGNTAVGGTLTSTGLVTANAGATVAGANLTVGTTTVDPTNGNTTVGGTLTMSTMTGGNNQSLYVDNAGLVTASNGSAARQASGMFTATATLTGGATTEAIADANVTATSVVIITYFGVVNESVRITVQGAGSFTVSTEGTNFTAGDKIHYMIINN